MSAVLILVNILLALIAIVLIVSVLAQEGTRQGLGAITGGAETFFGKNKAKTMEGKLELITKICAAAFIVLAIVSTMLTARMNGSTVVDNSLNGIVAGDTADDDATVDDETEGESNEDETEGEADAEEESTEGESAEE